MIRRVLVPVAVVLGLLVTSSTLPASAGAEPTAEQLPTTCVDGYGEGHVRLTAADDTGATFKIVLHKSGIDDPYEAEQAVDAGQTLDYTIPKLFYGFYSLEVSVGDDQILADNLEVTCVPVGDYKNPGVSQSFGCDEDSSLSLANTPIEGAQGQVLPVEFVVLDGNEVIRTVTLPDDDSDPYDESVDFGPGELPYPQDLRITADGEEVTGWPIAVPSCVADPEPPVPATGF